MQPDNVGEAPSCRYTHRIIAAHVGGGSTSVNLTPKSECATRLATHQASFLTTDESA